MTRTCKVVSIGGGSSYTPELIEGFIKRHDELPVDELWLVDVEEGKHKLDIITALAKRMIKRAGLKIAVHSTLDRAEALVDADFVITQFRVGQIEARILDETIPAKYGLIGQETNGAGGLFKGLRTIPVILDIISDCERLCPKAWIISFTNPVGMITEAVFRYTNWKRFVGLCNLPLGMEMAVAAMLNVEKSRLRIDIAGLNHMVFGLDVFVDGVSVMKQVLEMMGEDLDVPNMKNIEPIPWSKPFLKGLGVIPCAYHRYYLQKDEMLQALEGTKGSRGHVVKVLEEELFKKYADTQLDTKPKELEERGGAFYSEAACNLVSSLYNNSGDIQVVNTLNNGAIAGVPADVAVEVSSIITAEGPRPLTMGRLPVACQGLIQQIKSFELLACQAAISGKYEDALMAMVLNPLVQSEKIGTMVLEEMLLAHARFLPHFDQAIKALEARRAVNC